MFNSSTRQLLNTIKIHFVNLQTSTFEQIQKMTQINLNDPNLRCSLTLVFVRQKGQNSLVLIDGGNHGINIWTLCNFLAYLHSGRYDTCFPRRFYLCCCPNVLIKCIPGEGRRNSCLVWVKRRVRCFMSQRN